MSSPIDLTEDPGVQIPPDVLEGWLPTTNKSIFHLFSFNQYPASKTPYITPQDLTPMLHEATIPFFNHTTLPQFGVPADPSVSEAYQIAIRSAGHPIHSVTLTPHPGHGDSVTLPVWIFDYWREMDRALSYRKMWKGALMWLQSYSESLVTASCCHELMMALSFFPWSGNNVAVKDITSLLSGSSSQQSYLSSLHIDHMIGQISNRHWELCGVEVSGCHVFMTVDMLGTITTFYSSRRAPTKTGNVLWERLMEIENRIVKGEVDSVGGVYYLPLHWTSVVFDIRQGCIFYGDSLGQPIPGLEHKGFIQWVQRLNCRSGRKLDGNSVPVHPLPTGHQDDSTSCGLFALNALSHHYLDQPLLSPDQISLVHARMEIALDLLNGNTVRPTLYNIQYFNLVYPADCQCR